MKPGLFSRIVAVLIAVLFLLPTVVVIGSSFTSGRIILFPPEGFSFRWYEEIFTDSRWAAAFGNSITVGLLAAAFAIVIGIMLAIGAVRSNVLPSNMVTMIAVTPIIVPTVVLGIGFYVVAVNLGLTGSVVGLALAHSALGVPYVFITVLAALTAVEDSVEDAARISGASQLTTFLTVTLPLIAPSALIGGILAFISSWDEVIVAGFMTSPTFRTLPVLMFSEVKAGAEPSTSAVAAVVTVTSILLMAATALLTLVGSRKKRNPA
jgi:ABC-type spermidine/putrescine transport system permease subunit II